MVLRWKWILHLAEGLFAFSKTNKQKRMRECPFLFLLFFHSSPTILTTSFFFFFMQNYCLGCERLGKCNEALGKSHCLASACHQLVVTHTLLRTLIPSCELKFNQKRTSQQYSKGLRPLQQLPTLRSISPISRRNQKINIC